MLHLLFHKHPILTKLRFGIVHMCVNRFTGRINCAMWYPEGYKEKIDITHVDFSVFFTLTDILDAVKFVEEEYGDPHTV